MRVQPCLVKHWKTSDRKFTVRAVNSKEVTVCRFQTGVAGSKQMHKLSLPDGNIWCILPNAEVCCEAVRSAILATAWLLVLILVVHTPVTVGSNPAGRAVGETCSRHKVTHFSLTTAAAALATVTIVTVSTATTAVITVVTGLTLAAARLTTHNNKRVISVGRLTV